MSSVRKRKAQVGEVVSDNMDKTRVVVVDRMVLHPVFKKYFRRSKKFHMHDEKNESHVGDKVELVESKPISKLKRWKLKSILKKSAA